MIAFLREVDRLLRGEYTRDADLRQGRIVIPVGQVAGTGALLGAFYGACMGSFALLRHDEIGVLQFLLTTMKVPLLFLFSLLVTAPSLYVFSALARSRLNFRQTMLLLFASSGVITAVLASLGPVTVFFTVSTKSYPFIQILNLVVFSIAGLIGVGFLRKAISRVFEPNDPPPGLSAAAVENLTDHGARRARTIFTAWLVIYGVVGLQMGWVMRPFIGDPEAPTVFFRETEHHILRGILDALKYM